MRCNPPQNSGSVFYREYADAVVCIGIVFGNPQHTNPVFIAFESYKIDAQRLLFSILLQGFKNVLKISFFHIFAPYFDLLLK